MQKLKKIIFAILLAGFVFGLGGCETIKGMAGGFKKDTKNLWVDIKKADDWFRKNLW